MPLEYKLAIVHHISLTARYGGAGIGKAEIARATIASLIISSIRDTSFSCELAIKASLSSVVISVLWSRLDPGISELQNAGDYISPRCPPAAVLRTFEFEIRVTMASDLVSTFGVRRHPYSILRN
jgi:hypothetical protein